MSATLSKLRTSWVGRALLAYAVSALALVVLGLAAPGSAVFFPLVSLWCNLALFGLVLVVLRLADVKFDLFHWAVIIGFWAAALLYFYWAETRRSFVYIWDYVNYINKQYNAEAAFLQSPGAGFRYIFDSFTEDYTNFNTLFIEFRSSGAVPPSRGRGWARDEARPPGQPARALPPRLRFSG